MFDVKWIRDHPEDFNAGLAARGLPGQADEIISLDDERRAVIARVQAAQTRRNEASRAVGKAKKAGDDKGVQALMDEVAGLKGVMQAGEEEQRAIEARIHDLLSHIPNLPLADVPVGADESANVLLRSWGETPAFDFAPKAHFEIGEALGQMDFESAGKMSGARFAVLRAGLARLERALGAFMLDLHTSEFGYTEVVPPFMVRDEAMFGTAQLPKFADDLFHTQAGLWLIPTAEVSLTNLVRESIIAAEDLPLRFTALTPCFRAEAGAAGKDTRGLIRQHQFSKVELVSITTPEQSEDEHERMTACAEDVLKRLGLAYRVQVLCTGDMGFAARKTYDIEVWLPAQDQYREISSCSVCGEFQARRMNARYRSGDAKHPHYVHTLNGSGLAIGRTLVAILENYQEKDGAVRVPEALRAYMGGVERIEPL